MDSKIADLSLLFALLISIFSAVAQFMQNMELVAIVVLVFTGFLAGILNVEEEQRIKFIIGSLGILIANYLITPYLENLLLLGTVIKMLGFLSIFLGAATITVGFNIILDTGTSGHTRKHVKYNIVFWDAIVGVAICISLVLFVLVQFFTITNYLSLLFFADLIISLIFIIDLFFLYKKSKGLSDFVKHNIFDILAAIPFSLLLPFSHSSTFYILKLGRLVKIIRLTRFFKIVQTSKFIKYFSKNSSYNKLK